MDSALNNCSAEVSNEDSDDEDQKEADLTQEVFNQAPQDDDSDAEKDEGEKLPQEVTMMNKVTKTTEQNIKRARKDIREKVAKLIEDGNNLSSSFIQLKLLVLSATLNNRLINDNLMLAI